MTPYTLLSLWRERWGKAGAAALRQPLEDDALSRWVNQTTDAPAWNIPFLGVLAGVLFVAFTLVLAPVRFPMTDQLVVSALIVLCALALRRYRGEWATLPLIAFAFFLSTRYFYWRFSNTLGNGLSGEFFIMLGVLTLELGGFGLFIVRLAQDAWPVSQPTQPLTEAQDTWPRIAIYVVSAQHSAQALGLTLAALQQADWPPLRIGIYIIDSESRDEMLALPGHHPVHLLTFPPTENGLPDLLNQALATSDQDFAVVLMAGQVPEPNFLTWTMGALLQDPRLGLLGTAQHFLLPSPPPRWRSRFDLRCFGAEFLCLRRSLFMAAGGFPVEAVTRQANLALSMQARSIPYAYLSRNRNKGPLMRVNEPWSRFWSTRLAVLRASSRLNVYRPVFVQAVMALPLLYFLLDQAPLNAEPKWWAAYGLPHLLLAGILSARLRANDYLPGWVILQEGLLAAYIVILTAVTSIWTKLRTKRQRSAQPKRTRALRFAEWRVAERLTALLHALATAIGLARLSHHPTPEDKASILLYLAISAYLLLMQLAQYAIRQELRQITEQKLRLKERPAMVRLANGRTLTCQTSNFPERSLELVSQANAPLKVRQALHVSIFYHHNEFVFPAHVKALQDCRIGLDIDPLYLADYDIFAAACFSRGADWPHWLPGENVARLMPESLVRVVLLPLDKLNELILYLVKRLRTLMSQNKAK